MDDQYDEREEELSSITAIYPELVIQDSRFASIELPVTPSSPILTRFVPHIAGSEQPKNGDYAKVAATAHVEHDVQVSHLPPLKLKIELPDGYPSNHPPIATLATDHDWLPETKLRQLEQQAAQLWEEYGQCQILFTYIDALQQAAEQGFDLDQSEEGCLTLPSTLESSLIEFDKKTKLSNFNAGTYDCGICLEPKKGSSCYKLERCEHVFCRQCLQDFYNNAITEGDVATVRCLDPTCGKTQAGPRARKLQRPLHPRELLAMGVEEPMVRRYVDMKRKKRLESDKNTIYCPRDHCKHPARNAKYPPIPANLAEYPDSDSEAETSKIADSKKASYDPNDRLAVCENPKCNLAFCRICYKSWHGPYERCHPRDPSELSAEEKASYDYIAQNTSPCPYCNSPTQKTHGCNHMNCYQCGTHFCYLCGSWLDASNPYQHFNRPGMECYQRLWDLEGGDNGQGQEGGGGGVAFVGARHWEQMALQAAREADEAEARALQAEEDRRMGEWIHQHEQPIIQQLAQMHLFHPGPGPGAAPAQGGQRAAQPAARARGRGRENPFRAAAAAAGAEPVPPHAALFGQAAAVRAHERAGHGRGRGRGGGLPANGAVRDRAEPEQRNRARQQAQLVRFVQMAFNDEEDEWDSDGLGDEEDFVIH